MTAEGDDTDPTLSADEAFAVLGNEIRIDIMRTLGEANGPLRFSELRDRVGTADSGQFHYHLDRLTDHFVQKTENGYRLRQAGRRIVEAVLSGVVTDAPALGPEKINRACQYCGGVMAVSFRQDRLVKYCTECSGAHGDPESLFERTAPTEYGYLGTLPLPPAGVQGRSAEEAYDAAWIWANLEFLAEASGICSRCSATLEKTVHVCEEHDADAGLCEHCGDRHAIGVSVTCTNCINDYYGPLVLDLVAESALLSFLMDHGLNPVSPDRETIATVDRVHMDYTEEVRSTEPFEATVTFTVEDDSLTLTVDDDLTVTEVAKSATPG